MNPLRSMLSTVANPKRAAHSRARAPIPRKSPIISHGGPHEPARGRNGLAMAAKNNSNPREAFTYDDVLLLPGLSDVIPSDVDVRTHITREIVLNIPIVASAMDTVTEAKMAIDMAQAGG